jgi:hypothetical protein
MQARFDFFGALLKFRQLFTKIGNGRFGQVIRLHKMNPNRFCVRGELLEYLHGLIRPVVPDFRLGDRA